MGHPVHLGEKALCCPEAERALSRLVREPYGRETTLLVLRKPYSGIGKPCIVLGDTCVALRGPCVSL